MKYIFKTLLLLLLLTGSLHAQIGRGKITAAELFFDSDPGQGSGIALTLNGGINDAIRDAINTNATGLSVGLHTINVRMRDSLNQWGPVFKTTLAVENSQPAVRNISASIARLYWDSNIAGATPMVIFNGNATKAINEFIEASAPSTFANPGLHILNVQLLDPNGNYGPAFKTVIKFDAELKNDRSIKITDARYWLDNNAPPVSGNMIAFDGAFNDAFETALQTQNPVAVGMHTLHIQVRDSANGWGPTFTTAFSVEGPIAYRNINLAQAQVYWDNDTNTAVTMLAVDGVYDDAIESAIATNVSLLAAGIHKLNVRMMDVAGNWSKTFTTVITIENPITVRDIKLTVGEVSIDNNPPSLVVGMNGSFNSALEETEATLLSGGLALGLHTINVRMKGLDNNWGPYFKTAVVISPCYSTPTPVVTASRPLVFCNGDSTVLTANAGFTSYTWLNGNAVVGTGQSLTVKTSGSYTVVVTDATNCPNASLPKVVDAHILNPVITSSSVVCQGTPASLTAPAGFTTYSWSSGSSTNSQLINGSGTYTVTVTDAFGCSGSSSILINALAAPAAPTISANGPLAFCAGNNVSLTASATGAFVWSTGSTNANLVTDTTGNYTVTVTASNGCTAATTVSTQKLKVTAAAISVSGPLTYCADVASQFTANDSCTYVWSNGATVQSINPTVSGSYTVTVTNINGCTSVSAPVTVTVNPLPPVPNVTLNGPASFCNGGSVLVTSSTASSYLWSNGVTTMSQTVFASTTLTVTNSNAFGCSSVSVPVVINVHPVATINAGSPTTFCNGDSVILTAMPSSGVSYLWQNGKTTQSVTIKNGGVKSVIVTEISGGCKDTAYQQIVVNPLPVGSIAATGATTVCYNSSVTLTTSGSPNTKYQWYLNGSPIVYYIYLNGYYYPYNVYGYSYTASSTGNYSASIIDTLTGCSSMTNSIAVTLVTPPQPLITANGGTTLCIGANTTLSSTSASGYLWSTGETTQNIVAAVSGNYQVTITDGLGCTRASAVTPITFFPAASISTSGATTFCNGDSVSLYANPTGSYVWSNGSTASSILDIKTSGTYTLTVTDLNGCTSSTAPLQVIVNPLPTGSISAAGPTTFCSGFDVVLNAAGSAHTKFKWYFNGSPMVYYVYQYGQYVPYYVFGYNYAASVTGSYSAQIIDTITGCTSMTNTIAVTVNPLPSAAISQTEQVKCFGGNDAELNATASGTIAPYSYVWSNSTATALNSNISAGTYTVQVSDANGCTGTASYTVSQPSAVAPAAYSPVNTRGYNISCYGASDGTAYSYQGGTPPYAFVWSTGETTATIMNLAIGTYTVTVTDANNCSGSSSVTLTQPNPIVISLTPSVFIGGKNVRCYNGSDGSISVTHIGGTGPVTYVWSDGDNSQTNIGLTMGTYTVTVTDSVGCSTSDFKSLTEPDPMVSVLTPSIYQGYNVSCNGSTDGTISLNVTGGNAGYSYSWADTSYDKDRFGLAADSFYVTINDTNGCVLNDSIILIEPTKVIASTIGSTLNCYGDNNGTVSVIPSGGDAPYTYLWNNGSSNIAPTGLTGGVYQVTVTDSRGCIIGETAEVEQPQELVGYAFGTYVSCGSQIGLLSVTATGGIEPYSFLWSNGSTLSFQTNLAPGSFSVTVTDAHGCIDTSYAVIIDPPALFATTNDATVQCQSSNDGSLNCVATGGVPPFMYLWSNGATTSSIQNLGIGSYTVIVTDINGCTAINTPNITAAINVQNLFTVDNSCVGTNNGVVTVTSYGGAAPYSYLWSNGATTTSIANLSAGYYKLTVTEASGCFVVDSVQVLNNSVAITDVTIKIRRPCFGGNNGRLTVETVFGGANPFTYLWSTGETTAQIVGLYQGTYTLTVTDANGCKFVKVTTTNQRAKITCNPKVTNATCNACNGSIKVNIRGGAKPYTYNWLTIPGASTNQVNNLCKGVYELIVIDSLNCKQKFYITVLDGSPNATVSYVNDVKCYASNDGAIGISVSGGQSPYSYAWSNGASTQDNIGIAAGSYTLTVTDALGCYQNVQAAVKEPDQLLLNFTSTTTTITVQKAGGVGPFSYLWSTGNLGKTIGNNVTLTQGATYTVTVTDFNNCSASASIVFTSHARQFDSSVSVNESAVNLSLHPNPASDKATLVYENPFAGYVNLEVLDMYGRLLLTKKLILDEGLLQQDLQLADFNAGVYEVRVVSAKSTSSIKLIINR